MSSSLLDAGLSTVHADAPVQWHLLRRPQGPFSMVLHGDESLYKGLLEFIQVCLLPWLGSSRGRIGGRS